MSIVRSLDPTVRQGARAPRISRSLQIFCGLAIGVGGGLAVHVFAPHSAWVSVFTNNVTGQIGDLFLRLLLILVLPLVFSAVIGGIAGLRDVAMLRKLGTRALCYTIAMSALAALIGQAVVNLFRPGDGIDQTVARRLLAAGAHAPAGTVMLDTEPTGLNNLADAIPVDIVGTALQGNLIGVILLATLIGIGLLLVRTDATRQLMTTIEGLFQVGMRLMSIVMRFAPIAIACFMFDLTVMFGWSLFAHLGAYIGVVLLALALHASIVIASVVWIGGSVTPLAFYRATQEAIFIAFGTASSQATLSTALKVAEEKLKLSPEVARFVLGVGSTINQNGTAIYVSVTTLFLAQALGTQLDAGQQLGMFALCILAGIGTAGVPAGSIPLVAMGLGMVGIPPQAIGLVIGVDRLLDMCRTPINVLGDLAIAVAISREP